MARPFGNGGRSACVVPIGDLKLVAMRFLVGQIGKFLKVGRAPAALLSFRIVGTGRLFARQTRGLRDRKGGAGRY